MAVTTYRDGTVDVVNGSSSVTLNAPGVSPGNVLVGHIFQIDGDDVAYTVAADGAGTGFTLTAPYAGTTASGVSYSLNRDFVEDVPVPRRGDVGPWAIMAEAVKRLLAKVNALASLVSELGSGGTSQWSVIDRNLTAPPGAPVEGDTYIPAGPATGVWAGHENEIALFDGTEWIFTAAQEGDTAWLRNEDLLTAFDGSAWVAVSLPTPIVNDRMLMTEGGAYVFKDRMEIGRRLAAIQVFDTPYTSGTIGAADHGKSYSVDISTVPTISFDDPETLPLGWSVTIRATGSPTGFRTADLSIPAGNFVFCGEEHGTSFTLLGRGEAFRVTKTIDDDLFVETLASPSDVTVTRFANGTPTWNNGPTSWLSVLLGTATGASELTDGANGGGAVAVSGIYSVTFSVYFAAINTVSASYRMQTYMNGKSRGHMWRQITNPAYDRPALTSVARLKQGQIIDSQLLVDDSQIFYDPLAGNTNITITFLGR
ncbi:MAG: DUF2793 domain-containing protein [Parvibaculaceae bacterium]|nr:DUF2793 domain-containing protein [Parvibaculaceae bacterium]